MMALTFALLTPACTVVCAVVGTTIRTWLPEGRSREGIVLVISALPVAGAVFLILGLDGPFEELIAISSEPLRFALANLGR